MGERHRLLGDNRGSSDMRIGSLVKSTKTGEIGIIVRVERHTCLVAWADTLHSSYSFSHKLEVVVCE